MPIIGEKHGRRVQALLDSLATIWEVKEDGNLTTQNSNVDFVEASVVQLLDRRGSKLTSYEFELASYRAIRDVIKSGNVTVAELVRQFDAQSGKTLRERASIYYFQTKMPFSAPHDFWMPVSVLGERAVLCRTPPKLFRPKSFFLNGYGDVEPDEPFGGTYCVGKIKARSPIAAAEAASTSIAIAMGVVNFWLNLGVLQTRIGKPEPRAVLAQGQETVLFDTRGKIVEDAIAFNMSAHSRVRSISSGATRKLSDIQRLIGRLDQRSKKDRIFYRDIFRIYNLAVNESDIDNQLIQFWKLAELVTFAGASDTSVIAQRLAVTWPDKGVVEAICTAAGHRRNWIVHNIAEGTQVVEVVEMFRNLVEYSIWKSLADEVTSVDHWRDILDLTTSRWDLDDLEQSIAIARKLRR